jgi:adenylate cyclase
LFEIGGIGAPFSLSLPSRSIPLGALPEPLPVQFAVLEGKFLGRSVHGGHLTELSDSEVRLCSRHVPAVFDDLKITVAATSHGNPAGEIYGKVVEITQDTQGLARVRVTSATPELKAWMASWSSA